MALQKEYILDKIDNIETNIGTLSNLTTAEKGNLVASLNETTTNINTKIGTLANLNTTVKDSIVNAVCEVKDDINDIILGGVPDDSITDIKLSSVGIKATVAQHTTDINSINTDLADIKYYYTPEMYEGTDTEKVRQCIQNSIDDGKVALLKNNYTITTPLEFNGGFTKSIRIECTGSITPTTGGIYLNGFLGGFVKLNIKMVGQNHLQIMDLN